MKTAISIPNETFRQVEQATAAQGMSRSEFFTNAARVYLEQLAREGLTQRIDAALDLVGPDESAAAATAAGRDRLRREDW